MAVPFDPQRIFERLAACGVEFVLVGGLAGVLHGSSAMTNDMDIVPDPSPENLERLAEALRQLHARLRDPGDPEGVAFDPHPLLLGSMSVLNTTTDFGDLDLTFTPAGLGDFAAIAAASDSFDLDGTVVQVAALDDVIRSKEAADRPKDHATLPILRALRNELANRGEL